MKTKEKVCQYFEFVWLGGTHPYFFAEDINEAILLALNSEYGKNHDANSIRRCQVIFIPYNIKGKSNWTQKKWNIAYQKLRKNT